MASKKKVSLNDYELSTTLGTGKVFNIKFRIFWQSETLQEQEDWGVLCNEDPKESRYYQVKASRSCHFREHNFS